MNDSESVAAPRQVAILAAISVTLLWLAQPPASLWPCALIALIPMLHLAHRRLEISRRGYAILWGCSVLYWLVSLQGLRHAHPAMFIPWIALAAYLGVYHILFVAVLRRMLARRIPLIVAAPIAWVAQECIRNYLITGLSALMLGHAMADVPVLIQIADLGGTYAISFVIALFNVAAYSLIRLARRDIDPKRVWLDLVPTGIVVIATVAYGVHRLGQPLGEAPTTFALVQRSEPVEYQQSFEREVEIYQSYARQSVDAVRDAGTDIDVVVWPESMFSGGQPWMMAAPDVTVPEGWGTDRAAFLSGVKERVEYFLYRARCVQDAIAAVNDSKRAPQLIVGCGVIDYGDQPNVYSSVLSIRPDGSMADWYGKTHLVMFGEYVPIVPSIPGLRRLVPPGMGLATGSGAKSFQIGSSRVSPNICIETAVERVVVNQMRDLLRRDRLPDVVVTVTNDGWFDQSSVIAHHRRCAQLVAVGCRRPILSAANNGPTAWIDSRGQIVDQLSVGSEGAVIATPNHDSRTSLYVQIGDWPAWICVALSVLCAVIPIQSERSQPTAT